MVKISENLPKWNLTPKNECTMKVRKRKISAGKIFSGKNFGGALKFGGKNFGEGFRRNFFLPKFLVFNVERKMLLFRISNFANLSSRLGKI